MGVVLARMNRRGGMRARESACIVACRHTDAVRWKEGGSKWGISAERFGGRRGEAPRLARAAAQRMFGKTGIALGAGVEWVKNDALEGMWGVWLWGGVRCTPSGRAVVGAVPGQGARCVAASRKRLEGRVMSLDACRSSWLRGERNERRVGVRSGRAGLWAAKGWVGTWAGLPGKQKR